MEFEELKNTWSALDERLKRQEALKENIIKEMLKSKSGEALNRLINYTYFGIIICLIVIIPLVYRMTSTYFGVFKTSIFIMGIGMLLLSIIIGIYNITLLNKIDFTKKITSNIKLVENYNIRIKKQLAGIYALAFIFIALAIIAGLISPNMETWRWIAIIACIPVAITLAIWEYKRIYKFNIDSISSSLKEIRELEQENE